MKWLLMLGLALVMAGGTSMPERAVAQEYVLLIEETMPAASVQNIRVLTKQGTVSMPMEQYLAGVVLTEMPASFSQEALKAQAVAARTYLCRMMNGKKHKAADICSEADCCQAWRSAEELQDLFGEQYTELYSKGLAAAESTKGQALFYGDELIEALYYSCSGGRSEAAVAVWGTEVPYLQAVNSPGEEKSLAFASEVRVGFREFEQILKEADESVKLSLFPQKWAGETKYTAGGGVEQMMLGGVSFTGRQLRALFHLPSTMFTLRPGGYEMIFQVRGNGHRVGMSQYGAEAMAQNGADYREILQHYYTGVSIKKLSRTGSGQWSAM